jgi:integrase
MGMPRITKRAVDALETQQEKYFVWDEGDRAIKGFGVAVYPSGQRSYVFQYRNEYGQTKRMTIGKHGRLTPDQARKEADKLRRNAFDGQDPAFEKNRKRKALTVNDLLDEYLNSEKFAQKAETTRANDLGRINRHLRPMLGRRVIETLHLEDIRRAFSAIRDGKTASDTKTRSRGRSIVKGGEGAARMAIRVIRAIFAWGVEESLIAQNPAVGIKLGRDGVRSSVLESQAEYVNLFESIDRLEKECRLRPQVADCIRVLALTGARKNEIAAMRWDWVDLKRGVVTLPASAHKTGKETGSKEIYLPAAAQEIISRQFKDSNDGFIFTPAKGHGPISLSKPWQLIRGEAGLPKDLGIHGLRHSLATLMATQGAAAPQIMSALGHRQLSTAARYIKTVEDARQDVMEKHTAGISAALSGNTGASVKQLRESTDGK